VSGLDHAQTKGHLRSLTEDYAWMGAARLKAIQRAESAEAQVDALRQQIAALDRIQRENAEGMAMWAGRALKAEAQVDVLTRANAVPAPIPFADLPATGCMRPATEQERNNAYARANEKSERATVDALTAALREKIAELSKQEDPGVLTECGLAAESERLDIAKDLAVLLDERGSR
jgi:hypothetical protein